MSAAAAEGEESERPVARSEEFWMTGEYDDWSFQ
jgi:hypothetical protein